MAKKLAIEQLLEAGLEEPAARAMLPRVNRLLASLPAPECWQAIVRDVLTPAHPFALHQLLHQAAFADWDDALGPAPAWFPSDADIEGTNIARLMETTDLDSYRELYGWSVENRADFWNLMVQTLGIQFSQACTQTLDLSEGVESPKWFAGARLNIADSCFNGPGTEPALVFQAEGGEPVTITRDELKALTGRVANGLTDAGLRPGDAVAIDMPMTAESVAIYLGVIRAGGAVVSIADSFAAGEIEKRLRLGRANAVFTQDYIARSGKRIPLYDRVVAAGAPRAIVLSAAAGGPDSGLACELRDGDLSWAEFLSDDDQFESVACRPADLTNVLFSSGTTGDPKAIPWTQTTPIKCAMDGYVHHDIRPGDVVAWPTNLGWMMGPWLIYAGLVNQAAVALYYGAPTGREFCRFVQDARVTMLGIVPTIVRAWKDADCIRGLDWSAIRAFSSSGECSNREDMLFLMSQAGYRPIIEYCGGTEIGGGYITGTVVQPCAPATFTTPSLGLDFVILDEAGKETDNGEVFLIPPSIGLSTELLNADHHEVYYEGAPRLSARKPEMAYGGQPLPRSAALRRHGDQLERLGGGCFRMLGRADDTMNLGGIKVSSAEIERILDRLDDVQETAAIAIAPPGRGPSRLVVYAALRSPGAADKDALKQAMQAAIKQQLNPLFKIHDVVVIDSLPRTASNKVMRRVLRDQYCST